MIHTLQLGVAAVDALDFWAERLRGADVASERRDGALAFADPEGLRFELAVAADGDAPLRAEHPEIAPEHAITGVTGARAYAGDAGGPLLTEVLGFDEVGAREYRLEGDRRHFHWGYDEPPAQRGRQGAGSIHHIAWASRDEDHLGWQGAVAAAGIPVTDVRDRDYFRSIYFPDPRGPLFEIATLSPGFAVDEDPEHLGEELRLPAMHAHLRERLERTLTPVVNPRAARRGAPA
jgi:glyoxalase family protein